MNITRKKILGFFTIVILALFVTMGCKDDDNVVETEGSGTIAMKLGDAPFPIDLVARAEITVDRIDLRSDSEVGSDNTMLTYLVLDEPQTFDLIDFRNGLVADLPNVLVSTGSYDLVRMHISDAEIELTDGTVYNLTVPSGASSGLKIFITPSIQVNADITYEVLLDFDLTKSFVVQGNPDTPAGINGFHFKPVVRAVNLSEAGSIYGNVTDADGNPLLNAHVWVERDSVIASTYCEIDGSYRIIGLPSGSYNVYAEYTGLLTSSVDGVNVSAASDNEVNFQLSP